MKAKNIVSPYTLALVSYLIFLLAWVFPPEVYSTFVAEPDLMFLEPRTFFFYTLCAVAFGIGVWLVNRSVIEDGSQVYSFHADSPLIFLLVPLALSTFACCLYILVIGATVPNLGALMSAGAGNSARGLTSDTPLIHSLPLHSGVLWWAARRSSQLKVKSRLFQICFAFALMIGVVTCIIRLDRTNLMPMLGGVVLVYLYNKATDQGMSFAKLARMAILAIAVTMVLFLGISSMRGNLNVTSLITSIMGYTLVSYNRMAAAVLGTLHFTYAGHGVYLSPFLSYSTSLPVHDWVGGASPDDVWQTEFLNIGAAGLMTRFNWTGVFGYLFMDLGWWTPLYMSLIGLICGWGWRAFKAGKTFGTILYPWFGFCTLFWFGWNAMFEVHIVVLLGAAFALSFYEWMLLKKEVRHTAGIIVPSPAHSPLMVWR